jgi:hypothetical protein
MRKIIRIGITRITNQKSSGIRIPHSLGREKRGRGGGGRRGRKGRRGRGRGRRRGLSIYKRKMLWRWRKRTQNPREMLGKERIDDKSLERVMRGMLTENASPVHPALRGALAARDPRKSD